jgi:signal recognition particle receptor subunit beta
MVVYNASTRELTAKIVYYGPGLGGKTTNLRVLHDRLEPGTAGKLLNLATHTDRTIYFDLLPVELGDIKGYKIRFQLATVPGQTAFNETRRVVLKGVDGIVFVADSQWTMLPKNLESWQNLKDNLKANGVSFEGIPIVIQFNKRDLPDILAVDAMQEALGLASYPFVEAVASAGRGVTESFKLISKLTFVDLLRRLQGHRPEEAVAAAPGVAPPETRQEGTGASAIPNWRPTARPSRPLSLVPPTPEEPPFDTTELAQIDEEDTAGPFTRAEPSRPAGETAKPASPAETVRLEAVAVPSPPAADSAGSSEDPEELQLPLEPAATPATMEEDVQKLQAQLEEKLRALQEGLLSSQAEALRELEDRLASRWELEARALEERLNSRQEERGLAVEERIRQAEEASERRLGQRAGPVEEAISGLLSRLEAFERDARSMGTSLGDARDALAQRLSALEEAGAARGPMEARLGELEESLASETKRQRHVEDDVSVALRDLGERVAAREEPIAHLLRRVEELEGLLHEKSREGRREAEDIRTQLAPLLEERVRRHESDALLFSEMERLRDSLAEAMQEVSERLRRTVRP